MNTRAERFPLFDSLRAIAFLFVFVAHAAFFAGFAADGSTLRPYIARLDVGVRIFFLISAFLLYRPFVAARLRGEPPPYAGAYAWRRFLRVTPAYWLALTAVGLWLGATTIWEPGHLPLYYGFAHVYTTETLSVEGLPQAWSLAVEVAFYVFLPVWAATLRRLPGRDAPARLRVELGGIAALFAFSVGWKLWVLGKGAATDPALLPWHFALPEFLDYFAIGMALAVLSVWYQQRDERPGALRLLEKRPWLPWLGAAVAFVVAAKGIGLTGGVDDDVTDARFLTRHYLYALVALGVLLPAVWGDPDRGWVRRLLANRALMWVGMVSYGAFLFHFAVLTQMRDWGFGDVSAATSAYIWFPVALLGSLLIAAGSWYAFERPLLRLRRLVSARDVERGEATLEPAPAAPPETVGSGR